MSMTGLILSIAGTMLVLIVMTCCIVRWCTFAVDEKDPAILPKESEADGASVNMEGGQAEHDYFDN